jgi:hypothetical protein
MDQFDQEKPAFVQFVYFLFHESQSILLENKFS